MDLITQGLAGALLAQSAARVPDVRRAALIGAIAGMLPDADILIRAADDPLFSIEYHRHFTHSLLFVPFGALLVTLLAWPFLRERLSAVRIYGFALLGMLSAGLLDACTSFGTHLLWPLSHERIAWNLIAIVDPVFSLVLLVALLMAWRRRSAVPARFGLGLALLYLSLAFVQQQRAIGVVLGLAEERDHKIDRLEVKPTLGNILLWRSLYQVEDLFYVNAVRVGWFSTPRYYAGGPIARGVPDDLAVIPADSVLMQDIERFSKLADGYLVRHPEQPWVLGDIRYAMLPNSLRPLWGIHINTALPDEHVEFLTLREMNPEMRQEFLDMLLGRD
ncbi:MAG: metal-dependent hydrolase [Gammaproteobacteria bacterium]|nr:metal-dependent hydrolase [Gammaproteobacteria bacterium]